MLVQCVRDVYVNATAVCCTVALVTYPAAIELDWWNRSWHGYGAGYGLAWMTNCLFIVATICMCLDDIATSVSSRRRRRLVAGDRV